MTISANCTQTAVKFLYSYGGKIIPRPNDGQLRYVGGYTRVLSVDRSITFSELMTKFAESCGSSSMVLKCKMPSEDLDLLISIKSDEELKIVIKEYDRASPESKIRAVLFPIKSVKKIVYPPLSPVSCLNFPSAAAPPRPKPRIRIPAAACYYAAPPCASTCRCCSPVVSYRVIAGKCRECERRSVTQCSYRDYSCCPHWH